MPRIRLLKELPNCHCVRSTAANASTAPLTPITPSNSCPGPGSKRPRVAFWQLALAASALVLLGLNVGAVFSSNIQGENASDEVNKASGSPFVSERFSIIFRPPYPTTGAAAPPCCTSQKEPTRIMSISLWSFWVLAHTTRRPPSLPILCRYPYLNPY